MPTANFHLEKRVDKVSGELITKNVPIYLDFNFNGKRLQYFTGYRIDASKWDDGIVKRSDGSFTRERTHPGRAKKNTGHDNAEINVQLTALLTRLNEICETAKALKIPITVEYLRNELKNDPLKKRSANIFEAFDQFINERKSRDAYNTIKKFYTTYNHLKDFCGKRTNVDFHDLSLAFLERFKSYLVSNLGHSHNTVVKNCKIMKTFANWASERGYKPNPEYTKFKIDSEKEPAIIFLTWQELMHVYKLKIDSEYLRQVRDVFCFGCFTGQRYSDILNLKPEHIVNDVWINAPIKSHDTRPLYIPLNNYAKQILAKYKNLPTGKALPVISIQKMNDYLKELGHEAELFSNVTIYRFKGGVREEKTMQKCDVLSTHIMRKTFVTNALSLGMPATTIKEFTGHKSERDFKRYFEVIMEDKIKAMDIFNQAGKTSMQKVDNSNKIKSAKRKK